MSPSNNFSNPSSNFNSPTSNFNSPAANFNSPANNFRLRFLVLSYDFSFYASLASNLYHFSFHINTNVCSLLSGSVHRRSYQAGVYN
jgi:hypothetical protein